MFLSRKDKYFNINDYNINKATVIIIRYTNKKRFEN